MLQIEANLKAAESMKEKYKMTWFEIWDREFSRLNWVDLMFEFRTRYNGACVECGGFITTNNLQHFNLCPVIPELVTY